MSKACPVCGERAIATTSARKAYSEVVTRDWWHEVGADEKHKPPCHVVRSAREDEMKGAWRL